MGQEQTTGKSEKKRAFPPLVNHDCKVLLLGTMPSEESLKKQQYYGHPHNQFWKLLFYIFDTEFTTDYTKRKSFALDHHLAIWDVLACCQRKGSADSAITAEEINDFDQFFKTYPSIRSIFFTSQKAAYYYKKQIGFDPQKTYHTLPSPSPANARTNFETKAKAWNIIKEIVD